MRATRPCAGWTEISRGEFSALLNAILARMRRELERQCCRTRTGLGPSFVEAHFCFYFFSFVSLQTGGVRGTASPARRLIPRNREEALGTATKEGQNEGLPRRWSKSASACDAHGGELEAHLFFSFFFLFMCFFEFLFGAHAPDFTFAESRLTPPRSRRFSCGGVSLRRVGVWRGCISVGEARGPRPGRQAHRRCAAQVKVSRDGQTDDAGCLTAAM